MEVIGDDRSSQVQSRVKSKIERKVKIFSFDSRCEKSVKSQVIGGGSAIYFFVSFVTWLKGKSSKGNIQIKLNFALRENVDIFQGT